MRREINGAVRGSTSAWIKEHQIKNEKGKRVRVNRNSPHFFLGALYKDRSQKIAVRKPSQCGVSTWLILDEIHDTRFLGYNYIHTLPTANDVAKFVPSKVNEIIKRNPSVKKGMANKEVNAIAQKQFGKGFLYFKGTKSESDTLMLTSDVNNYDEYDKSDMSAINAYASRQEGADSKKKERWVSTPTVPDYGIDAKFKESDQKHWRFKCPHKGCGKKQHMEWPENIDMERECYICKHCKGEITTNDIRQGKWEARYPGREISGYWITQMIVPWVTAKDMIKYYRDAEAGRNEATFEYFYNHKLGQPYVAAGSQIPKGLILQNLTTKEHVEVNSIAGVDVQLHELYVMVGNDEGVYAIAILRDDQECIESDGKRGVSKWDRLGQLIDVYDIRYMVIDGGFTPNEVIDFALKHPGKVWVNWYKDDPKKEKIIRWSDDDFQSKQEDEAAEIRVLTERDRQIDWVLHDLRRGGTRFFYRAEDDAIKRLIQHTSTTYARIVTDRRGDESREWVSTGKDDFLHALVYYTIARERKRRVEGD